MVKTKIISNHMTSWWFEQKEILKYHDYIFCIITKHYNSTKDDDFCCLKNKQLNTMNFGFEK